MNVKTWWSIRQRLTVTFISLTILAGVLQLGVAGSQIEQLSFDFFLRDLQNDAYLMRDRLTLQGDDDDEEEISARVRSLEFAELVLNLGHDYAILSFENQLRAASLSLYNDYWGYNEIPEVEQAYRQGSGTDIRIGSDGQERLYVAVPFYHDEHVIGALILSQPTLPLYNDIRTRWMSLGLATLPVLSLAVMIGAWFGARIALPIKALHDQALQIAKGDLDVRVDPKGKDEIGALGMAFNHMADQLRLLLQAQRSFVSNAAHELRTPLMTFQLRLEALQSGQLSDEQQRAYIEEARQELQRMARLVTSLLTLARLDERHYSYDNSPYDVMALLSDLTRSWQRNAQKAGIKLENAWQNVPDVAISAQDLRMVLDNLLSNAIKYTPNGGQVRLTNWQEAGWVYLCVEDSGMGFSPEQAERLFTRFYRTEQARAAGLEGTGLGLSIARAVVEQARGVLTAHSEGVGRGACFVLGLPIKTHSKST